MTTDSEAIYEAALKLPEPERLVLVTRLMETLPPDLPGFSLDDPGLHDELERRWAENDEGVAWSELRDKS